MIVNLSDLDNLLTYCTPNQSHVINLIKEHGSFAAVSRAIGKDESTIRKTYNRIKEKAAMAGYAPEANLNHAVPQGFSIKRVSTLTNKDGEKTEWVIKERDKEDQYNAMQEAIESLCSQADGKALPTRNLNYVENDLLTAYIIGDQHHSMLSWHEETGDDYDMTISEQILTDAVSHLTDATRSTQSALIVNCGDWFHGNDGTNRTPKSGNVLDVDGRLTKIIRTGMQLMVKVIDKCLQKHNTVMVRNAMGNHSHTLEMFMSEFLSAWYRNEPRVKIHNEPKPFWYHQFGNTLLAVTHGDTIRPESLGELMAADCEDIWSTTKHRYWILGHVHSKHSWEMRTCIAESFNTLAAKDAWHNEKGYRSKRNMTAITYHNQHGEIARNTVDIGAICPS